MKLSKTNRRLMAALLCGALILGSGALPTKVDAASSSEIQGQIDELQRKSDEFDAQLSALEQKPFSVSAFLTGEAFVSRSIYESMLKPIVVSAS